MVALAIFEAVIGNELTCLLISSVVSCSVPIENTDFISVDASDNGNRDNASTFAFCFDVDLQRRLRVRGILVMFS